MKIVKKWDFAEFTFFLENEQEPDFTTPLKAVFTGEKETLEVEGFYDGAGRCTGESIYKIRFMPSYEGHYTFIRWSLEIISWAKIQTAVRVNLK